MSEKSDRMEQDLISNECSLSTKEFLQIEKSCERYKDSDDEINLIFNEINKLSEETRSSPVLGPDSEDVGLILKRAAEISHETENLLRAYPKDLVNQQLPALEPQSLPEIKVSKHLGAEVKNTEQNQQIIKVHSATPKHIIKENANEPVRRKQKNRPVSASVVDSKKKETVKTIKATRSLNSSPKKCQCKHTSIIEELKDTSERSKGLELMNVQLTDDNKALRKKLEEVMEKHHISELKLNECEKFVTKIGKEYENRTNELKNAKENECRALAELTRERNDSKNLKMQHEKDLSAIQDLKRQCKEMEMILRRKHPDSVSALIVASKQSTVEDNKKKLLEDRINRLEQELKDKEEHFQNILLTLQEKFGDMKQKYENHIIDVERQLMDERKINAELRSKISKANLVDESIQTTPTSVHSTSTQTFLKSAERASSAVSRLTQNSALILNRLKEDSYLVATIKGLQSELTVKQRTIAKINRETEELRKNLRNLQKEKEVLMNINPQKKPIHKTSKSTENIVCSKVSLEIEAELTDSKKHRETLMHEKASLLESLKRTNEELIMLKKKRIQDLHTLQLSHEKELMQMNLQIYPLQEETKLLSRTVEILQERVRTADDKLLRYQSIVRDNDIHAGGDTGMCRVRR